MVGAGRRVLEMTADYAKTRVQFDQPIGVNQYVQEHCVAALADLDASSWLTYYAAWKLKEGIPAAFDVAVAKAWNSDAHERICWRAHQVFAGDTLFMTGFFPFIRDEPNHSRITLEIHLFIWKV